MQYIAYKFILHPPKPWSEILLAKLAQIEFESFEENEFGLNAYILKDYDDEEFIKDQITDLGNVEVTYEKSVVEQVNWNSEWEKNFHPIEISDQCYIRAEFHASKDVPYEIIIQPKMSFGTGHHETTHLMVEFLLEEDLKGKSVLDMGTGTGILAILAKMKGASKVVGIDIDEWSYDNAVENAERNQVDVTFYKGGAEVIPSEPFDVILANINKNILIADMPFYINALKPGGTLFLSGLYNFDKEDMLEQTESYDLGLLQQRERNEWMALKFMRP